jgi:hypothetical protein
MALALSVAACASAPTVQGGASLTSVAGQPAGLLATAVATKDATAQEAERQVLQRFAATGAPRYRLQIAFVAAPAQTGVSTVGAGTPLEQGWISSPDQRRMRWRKRAKTYVLTVVGLDAASGKTAFQASATDHDSRDAAKALPRLVDALFPPSARN